jgi:hypothetical protein
MKATKALKRLAKIGALLSDVAARYSVNDSDTRKVLQDASAAVGRAKEIVSLQAAGPARKKAAAKKAEGTTAKPAKKRAPIKKAAKRKAATRTASAAVQTAPEAARTGVNVGQVERASGPGLLPNDRTTEFT